MHAEGFVRVMGTSAHVIVAGDDAETLAAAAIDHLRALERKWSRFLPDSEISRANACAGSHVVVSPETVLLVQRSIEGWKRSRGVFDPTVLAALRAAGYDRDFASVRSRIARVDETEVAPTPGCAGLKIDTTVSAIRVPEGVAIDPGGIGKGLAADLVTERLLAHGADGALVNIGGDLRARGTPSDAAVWQIALEDPARPQHFLLRFGLGAGAVATSSRVKRQWSTDQGFAHHLIDPRDGRPCRSRHATVAAVAQEAWWAEVVAKTVLIDELHVDAGTRFGVRLVTVDDQGCVECDRAFGVAA